MQSELPSVDLALRQMQDRRDQGSRERRGEESWWRRGVIRTLATVRDLLTEHRRLIREQGEEVGRLGARRVHLRRAQLSVTALTVGASLKVTATWETPMPVDAYDVEVMLPSVMVGKVTRTVSTSKTGAVITLKATAVVLSAGVLDVTAYVLA